MCKCAAKHKIQHDTCIAPNATILSQIGDSCSDDTECQQGSMCREKRCACSNESTSNGDYCSRLGKVFKIFNLIFLK